MIGFLSGNIIEIREKEVILLTSGGVGYAVYPAGSLLAQIQKDKPITAEICTIVKENEISLYGFGNKKEKQLFQKLIAISGIGPKTAIQMVSVPTDQFLLAVENGDIAFLTKMPGLGKKTAERLVIELRGKLDFSKTEESKPQTQAEKEASEALKNLGYEKATIYTILQTAPKGLSAEALVTFFLKSNQ